jgi:hypothetical protein
MGDTAPGAAEFRAHLNARNLRFNKLMEYVQRLAEGKDSTMKEKVEAYSVRLVELDKEKAMAKGYLWSAKILEEERRKPTDLIISLMIDLWEHV